MIYRTKLARRLIRSISIIAVTLAVFLYNPYIGYGLLALFAAALLWMLYAHSDMLDLYIEEYDKASDFIDELEVLIKKLEGGNLK